MDGDSDEFSRKLQEQIKRNNLVIAEAKKAIDKMRDLFKSLGADLDSGRNIFLESPFLSEESRRQAKEAIAKMEEEMAARHAEYKKSIMKIPGDSDLPNDDGTSSGGDGNGNSLARRRAFKKMRL
ncbi:MAG: hypothetical protein LBB38_02000 [Puniceicoccales bacterium]|jgi:hypothetical protein|nr:hypothetical protein [Puniceicoccales bacterium]